MGEKASTTTKTLSEFGRRALQSIEDKKIPKYGTFHVPSLDVDLKMRSLSSAEWAECMEMESAADPQLSDKYAVYISAVEPNLSKTGAELVAAGAIAEPMEIMDSFAVTEINELSVELAKLSGMMGREKVTAVVVEDLKNE